MLAIFVTLLPGTSHAQQNGEITVMLNGQKLAFDVNPIIINGRTMVPFRIIGESIGTEVGWNGKTKTVFGSKGSTQIRLTLGSDIAYINERKIK